MVRLFFFLSALSCFFFSSPAQAGDSQAFTKAEYEALFSLNATCRKSAGALPYDCDCVAMRYLDSTRATRAQLVRLGYQDKDLENEMARRDTGLIEKSYYGCANTKPLALHEYSRCLDWASLTRDDYESFCSCYAVRYAEIFSRTVSSWMTDTADMRASALKECSATSGLFSRSTSVTVPSKRPLPPR